MIAETISVCVCVCVVSIALARESCAINKSISENDPTELQVNE